MLVHIILGSLLIIDELVCMIASQWFESDSENFLCFLSACAAVAVRRMRSSLVSEDGLP